MNRRFGVLAAAICGMLLGLPGAQAADTWPVVTSWDAKNVSIQLAMGRGDLVIQPGEFNLQAGELYRFVVVNDTGVNHSLSAPELAGKVLTSDLTSMSIATGIVIRPGERVEWYMMPVTEGVYKFGCGNAVHAAAGMDATIRVL
jgi:uncharacterized cupredoxin-like copper-binding protein